MKNTNPDTEKKMVLDMTLGSIYKRRISRNKKIHKAKDKDLQAKGLGINTNIHKAKDKKLQAKGLVRVVNRVYRLKMKSSCTFSKKHEVNPFEADAKMDITFQATPRPFFNQGMLHDPLATPRPSLNQGMLHDPLATPRPSLNQEMLHDPLATPRPSLNQEMLHDPLATPRPADVVSSVLSNGLFGMTLLDAQAVLDTPLPHVVCPMESARDPLADLQESSQCEDAEHLCDKLEMFSLNRR